MSRRLRHIPRADTLVEVTCRTFQGRLLLTPKPSLNDAIIGTIARAKRRYGVRVCAAVFLSNHAHLLVRVDDAQQLARFMNLVGSKIAHEVKRRTGWDEKIWGRRYTAIIVSDEAEAQVARLRYLLSHGVKEHLVGRCMEWPGVHAAQALARDEPLVGAWLDRSAECEARRRCETIDTRRFRTMERLIFDPLPCWDHLSSGARRRCIGDLIAAVESEAKMERRRRKLRPMGVRAIRRQSPSRKARPVTRSPRPRFHAWRRSVHRVMVEGYRAVVAAYCDAAIRWRAGDLTASFPQGCFPPPLPFVSQ